MVADNGIGFDEKHPDVLFLPFGRLNGQSENDGDAMGLTICRKIIERHGGTISATSPPGQGAAFIAILPNQQDNEEEHQSSPSGVPFRPTE